jgi:hypothetical protein
VFPWAHTGYRDRGYRWFRIAVWGHVLYRLGRWRSVSRTICDFVGRCSGCWRRWLGCSASWRTWGSRSTTIRLSSSCRIRQSFRRCVCSKVCGKCRTKVWADLWEVGIPSRFIRILVFIFWWRVLSPCMVDSIEIIINSYRRGCWLILCYNFNSHGGGLGWTAVGQTTKIILS